MAKTHRYVPPNAVRVVTKTAVSEESVVIDFCFYSDKECELSQISKTGIVKKMLRFVKQVGQCKDGDELVALLKANNSCDISNSKYSSLAPENMKLYEVWHQHDCGERIFFTYAANTFYPIVFLLRHEF